MARKLKFFQTSIRFYDLAIAAPSMKAALEAWGADSNLFHQGVAKESKDPDVITATIAKPGVILRRPVGSNAPFKETAELPTDFGLAEINGKAGKRRAKKQKPARKTDDKAARNAALEYERAERQRESERRKEEAARAKERQRREQAVAKAQAALETAQREHDSKASVIEAERAAVEKRSKAEDARWEAQKHKLDLAVHRAHE